jgi:hypothetical protein
MMINEEILTLYYYNDGLSESERQEVERALHNDAVLAARFADLRRLLDPLRDVDDGPAPLHLVQRLHDSIDRKVRQEQQAIRAGNTTPLHFRSFLWGSVITAALAIGIGIGAWLSAPPAVIPQSADAGNSSVEIPVVPVAFNRGLQMHLQESQWELANLAVADFGERARLAGQLIEQNRFFERTATQNNAAEVARLLRAFEPILLRLASEQLSQEDAAALREKLAFEISVMLTKLARDTSKDAQRI